MRIVNVMHAERMLIHEGRRFPRKPPRTACPTTRRHGKTHVPELATMQEVQLHVSSRSREPEKTCRQTNNKNVRGRYSRSQMYTYNTFFLSPILLPSSFYPPPPPSRTHPVTQSRYNSIGRWVSDTPYFIFMKPVRNTRPLYMHSALRTAMAYSNTTSRMQS